MNKLDFNLMLITDRNAVEPGALEGAIEAALQGGIRCVQLREKDLNPKELRELAKNVLSICQAHGVSLILNGHPELCVEIGAQGIHIPESGPPVYEIRTLLEKKHPIGKSAHSLQAAKKAEQEGADYCIFGPVFETPSKKTFGPPQGLAKLREVAQFVQIPILAVGGIHLDNVANVLDQGVAGIAVIRSILSAKDITATTREFTNRIKR